MPLNTVTQQAPQQNFDKPNQRATIVKSQVTIKISAINSNESKTKHEIIRKLPKITMVLPKTNSNPNSKVSNNTKANNINNQRDRRSRPDFPSCETCGRTNHSSKKGYLGANAANRPPPRNRRRKDKTKSTKEMHKATQAGMSKLQPKL